MKRSREVVKIKTEAKEINLHVYFEFGGDGRMKGIKASQQTEVINSFISSLESLCPQCHCVLNLNFFVHDGLTEKRQNTTGHSEEIFSSSPEPLTTTIKEEAYEIHEVQLVDPMSFGSFSSKKARIKEPIDVPGPSESPSSMSDDDDDFRGAELQESPSWEPVDEQPASQTEPNPILEKFSEPNPILQEFAAKRFRCKICSQRLKNAHCLRKHIISVHNIKNEDIPSPRVYCRYCFTKFPTKRELLDHIADHSTTCVFCNQSIFNLHTLRTHLVKHHNDKSPDVTICPSCGKSVNGTFLTLHLKACQRFGGSRVIHEIKSKPGSGGTEVTEADGTDAETKPKSILCIYCQNVFYSKQELVEHQSNHSLECLLCEEPKMYTSLGSMKMHVRKFHGHLRPKTDDMKTCPKCSRDYNKGSFSTHLIRCMKDIYKPPGKKKASKEFNCIT